VASLVLDANHRVKNYKAYVLKFFKILKPVVFIDVFNALHFYMA